MSRTHPAGARRSVADASAAAAPAPVATIGQPLRGKSKLEARFLEQLVDAGLDVGVVRELRFCPPRLFRWDFAWPTHALAVEIHGATWSGGRHGRGGGIEGDAEKLAHAALLGWRVLVVPEKWLRRPAGTEGDSEAITWTRALLERAREEAKGERSEAVG